MSSRKSVFALGLGIALVAAPTVFAQQKSSPINEATLKAHIRFLSDDLLEGRGTGARGGELAAKYLAAQLEALGAKGPGEKGSFFQPVSLVGVKADPKTMLTVSGANGSES